MLHITNGDSAANLIKASGLAGDVLAWRDVLHEGAVPAGLSLEELSRHRARFIADCGWGEFDEVSREFQSRDATLARSCEHDEVTLWFEHDLYDQLQLIQLLDWFCRHPSTHVKLNLICIGEHRDVADFQGLGQLNARQIADLFPSRHAVTYAELESGARAWAAFCSADPLRVEALHASGTLALPFLSGALRRHLQQFPSTRNGLSRTATTTLGAINAAPEGLRPADIFQLTQATEPRVFLGDTTFFDLYLTPLATGAHPLIANENGGFTRRTNTARAAFDEQVLRLTKTGEDVLTGAQDFVALEGINLWRGGVHLHGHAAWRWDEAQGKLVAATAA